MIVARGLPAGRVEERADVERLALRARRRSPGRRGGCSAGSRGRSGPWPGRTPRGRGRRPSGRAGSGSAGSAPCRSRSRPSRHAVSRIFASRMCSRLRSGSASMPRSPRRLVAVVAIRSRKSSASSRTAAGGAANDLTIEIGRPAVLPGRVDGDVGRVAEPLDPRAVLAPLAEPLSPELGLLRGVRVEREPLAARVVLVDPRREVLRAQLAGRSGRGSGRSPFGSMRSTGMPSSSASSMSARQRPVLPLPVIPMHTAWVTRSLES